MADAVAVTGADGFIGGALCAKFEREGRAVVRIVRRPDGPGAERRVVPDLSHVDLLAEAFRGAGVVVHLAARAHVLRETEADPAAAFARTNVAGTANVAEAAARAGLRRVVLASSIGVNGSSTSGTAFTEVQPPAPTEPYAASKYAAELELREVAGRHGLEFAILRPSMVYGPGVKGNLRRLLALVHSGIPLPLASLENRRSLIGVENLGDLIAHCIALVAANGEVFLAAEPEVHSTPALLRGIAAAMGRRSRLFHCPPSLLAAMTRLLGLDAQYLKLAGSLEVSADKARRLLGWRPRISYEAGLRQTVDAYVGEIDAAR
jgi:nucleoside-diphosphate-sugar epimerase